MLLVFSCVILLFFVLVGSWIGGQLIAKFLTENDDDLLPAFCLCGLLSFMVAVVGVMPLTKALGGFGQDYSLGTRVGYVTKVSYKGIIWKTWEVEMQVGTGEQASLQAPTPMSVQDDAVRQQLQAAQQAGRRVSVHYSQWWLQPYSRGESGYDIISVD